MSGLDYTHFAKMETVALNFWGGFLRRDVLTVIITKTTKEGGVLLKVSF